MSTLAKRYANAIFELMEKEVDRAKDIISKEFSEMAELYKNNEELKKVLDNPTLKIKYKKEILNEIMKKSSYKSLTVKSLNFILESGRFSYIAEIAYELAKLVDSALGHVHATIIVAREMKKGLLSDPLSGVKKEIEKSLKGKKVIYDIKVESSIIGGVIVKIGDKLYDFSVRHSLESIKNAINQ